MVNPGFTENYLLVSVFTVDFGSAELGNVTQRGARTGFRVFYQAETAVDFVSYGLFMFVLAKYRRLVIT
jgi:hypothetical protein